MKLTKGKALLAAGVGAVAFAAVPAIATHAWSNYHWEKTGAEITVPVIDNTTGIWAQRNHTALAVADWNQSTVIEAPLQNGNADPSCPAVGGEIHVCNGDYGNTGWLGIASISITRSGRSRHISAGITKLNDFYFNQPQYNNDTWRQLVTCQEIGHDYGLGHQNEDFSTDLTTSCMEYTSQPAGNESPDAHDYEMLLDIYSHNHGGGGGGKGGGKGKNKFEAGNSPSDWGRAIAADARGRPNVYERVQGNEIIVTHVTWAIGEGPGHHH